MVYSRYGQETGITYNRQPIQREARHREPVSCPKIIGITRDVELFALGRSVTTWLIAPAATKYKSSNQDSETGHKIVNYGQLLANTSATILAKILMVGNADTSTLDE